MATTTFLGNASVSISVGATPTVYDLSDNCSKCEVSVGFDYLESTAFGDTGHQAVQGLQTCSVNMDLFLSYGVGEVETMMAAIQTAGNCTITVKPSTGAASASVPQYVITKATLDANQPIMSSVGELAVVSLSFTNGTWVRTIA
jgi:hypothetical protein